MGLGEKKEKVEEKTATELKYEELKARLQDMGLANIEKRLDKLENKRWMFFPWCRTKRLLRRLRFLNDWW